MALPAQLGPVPPSNPFSLGSTVVTSPGTAVKITANFTDADGRHEHWLQIRAYDNNTGIVFVICRTDQPPWTLPGGGTTSGADTTHYLNVVQILQPGETWSVPSWMMNLVKIGAFWVDSLNANDFVISAVGEA